MKLRHYYVTFVCGTSFGGLDIATESEMETSEDVGRMAGEIHRMIRGDNIQSLPLVVILNWRLMAEPRKIVQANGMTPNNWRKQ